MAVNRELGDRIAKVRARIAKAAETSGRSIDDITLLGASKVQSPELVAAAIEAGVTCLGENYVQEAAEKLPVVRARLSAATPAARPPRWHMIGALQRNKAKIAVGLFDVIETVDRASLANEINKRAGAQAKIVDIYLQVNLSREPQKAGVEETELGHLLASCAALEHVRVVGLMTIPAPVDNPADNRPVFARLRELRDALQAQPGGESLRGLSMGMSKDFEIAIEEGATVVRVGSDLFGPRPPKA